MPPPSKSAVAALELPVIEGFPMPADVPTDEAPHVEPVIVAGLMGEVPEINGLTAGAASSVAPIGILVGGTGEPEPKPSGDVTPSGGPGEMLIPPTCANAEPQSKRTAARTATATPFVIDEPLALASPLDRVPRLLVELRAHILVAVGGIVVYASVELKRLV
jgi:hypothetical protein